MVLSFSSSAQNSRPSFQSIKDSKTYLHSDSLDIKNDSITRPSQDNAKTIYKNIEGFSKKNKVYKEIFRSIFVNIPSPPSNEIIVESSNAFKVFSGYSIASVKIIQLNVFDKGFDESIDYRKYKLPPKGFSRIHINTSQKILKRYILFNAGDTINPNLVAQNSKLLRALPYLQNAFIQLHAINDHTVEVLVVTKDQISWDFVPIYLSPEKWRFRVRNSNIAGFGSEFSNNYLIDNKQKNKLVKNDLSLKIKNIAGTFINAQMGYELSNDYNAFNFGLSRSFIPYKTNWAGGFQVNHYKQLEEFGLSNENKSSTYTKHNYSDYWIGRQIEINKKKHFIFKSPLWLIPSVRFSQLKYSDRPYSSFSNYNFNNYFMILSSISASTKTYYKINYVNEFGKAEDIQQGFMVKFTGGYQKKENLERSYWGSSYAFRKKTRLNGLYYLLLDMGTFVHNQSLSQSTLKAKASYLFPLIHFSQQKLRNSFWIDYTIIKNRNDGARIYLENPDNTSRVILSDLYGTQKLIGHIESNLFTSLNLYGFKVSCFAAFEFGYIGFEKSLFKRDMVSALSLGIRIKNDFLIFNTIQFRFTFYSENLKDYIHTNFDVNEMNQLRFDDFSTGKPGVISY